ncbi:calcium/sodium antiporter [Candidatus Gracilibacteria bacterium]|nr:calcium/sodium antiporter [Candidatus Gracilibacteria bacterium]
MAFNIFLMIVGFVVLVGGADLLVRGASSIAKKMGISTLIIGLTIVAFGTSLPELVVSVVAAMKGSSDIAVGNIVGSNIANILLILGITGMISQLRVKESTIWKEIPFAILAVMALIFVGFDTVLSNTSQNSITRGDGAVLILFFLLFLYYIFQLAKSEPFTEDAGIKRYNTALSVGMIVVGLGGLVWGGDMFIDGAVEIAQSLGMSEALIGLTIVAVGTSMPELATSVVAALRGQNDIAVGNIVGSNIFNIFWILGASALINPLQINPVMLVDTLICLAITVLLFGVMFVGRKNAIDRWQGGVFFALYIGYVAYLVMR